MKFFEAICLLILVVLLLVSCSPNEGDTVEKYYTDDDDSGEDDDDSTDDDDNDTADDDDSVPPEIPDNPTELRAIESGANTINLTWTDNSEDEDGFWVYRQESGTKSFTAIAQTGPDVPFYFDDSAACETEYDYYVTAFNMAGESAGSNEAAATAGYCDVTAPTDLAAVTISQTQVDLSWSDNSFNETNFQIQRKETGSDVWVNIGDAEANVTEYSDLVAVCETDYQYRVRAYNQHSDSAWCDPAGTKTQDCPIVRPQPVLVSIDPGSYVALSRDYLEPPPDPLYPLEITGEGIAADTKVMMNNFIVPCDTGGEGTECQADDNGDPVAGTCATTCTASLPDDVMRHADEYVVRLFTPSPVFGGDGTSAEHEFFNVVAPQPVIDRIWPRGVLQLMDSSGVPIPQTINVRIWGRDILDNCQVRLHSNYGEVLSIDTDPDTGDQEIEALVSTKNITASDNAYQLGVINPGPGGGERISPFGVNPVGEFVQGSMPGDLRGTRSSSYNEALFTRTLIKRNKHFVALGTNGREKGLSVRDEAGNLLIRHLKPFYQSIVPLPLSAYSIDCFDSYSHGTSFLVYDDSPGFYKGGDGTFLTVNLTFSTPSFNVMDGNPQSMTLADFNLDGKLDLVAGNGDQGDTIKIGFGNDSNDFDSPLELKVGNCPASVATGDLNNDGAPDILSCNKYSDSISVIINDNYASFNQAVHYSMGQTPVSVAIGDIDQDGIPDVLTADQDDNAVSIRSGLGDGSFSSRRTLSMGNSQFQIGLSDLNGDGNVDLFTIGTNITIRLGVGNGAFSDPSSISNGSYHYLGSYSVPADINNDGSIDLLVYGNDIVAYVGKGDGTFHTPYSLNANLYIHSLDAGDINGDSFLDLFYNGSPTPTEGYSFSELKLGDGTGEFPPSIIIEFPIPSVSTSIVDLNRDGAPDILGFPRGSSLYAFYGNENTRIGETTLLQLDEYGTNGVKALDLNNDGNIDIISLNYSSINNGDGTFSDPTLSNPAAHNFDLNLLNADNFPDLVTSNQSSDSISLYNGIGDGSFTYIYDISVDTSPMAVILDDIDNDGNNDIVTANSASFSVLIGDGQGNFGTVNNYQNTGILQEDQFQLVDCNQDDFLDIIALLINGQAISLVNNGDGSFSTTNELSFSMVSVKFDVGDINGDQIPDLIGFGSSYGNVFLAFGNGDCTFSNQPDIENTNGISAIKLHDIDNDGNLDIIYSGYNISYRLGNGDGTFGTIQEFDDEMGSSATSADIIFADLNNDSNDEIIIGYYMSEYVKIMNLFLPGTWHQELTDSFSDDPAQPWLPKYAIAATNTLLQIHQYRQTVSKVGATLLLEWTTEPSGTVGLVLTAPDGQEVDLGSYSTFTPWPDDVSPTSWRLNKVFREYDLGTVPGFPNLENLHGLQPTGNWELEINNQTGADAEVKNWTVITDGEF